MDRANLQATLLLRGFNKGEKKHNWFIGVASPHGIKNFVSAKKAWRYISEVLQSYD